MANTLPYLATPGSIKTALERIRDASVPERVTYDFIATKLQIKGGTGRSLLSYLKKLALVSADGAPTELYKQFRNKLSGGNALGLGIKQAYSDLAESNEYFYDLKDSELKNLIVQVSGLEKNNKIVGLIYSTLQNVKAYANFDDENSSDEQVDVGLPTIPVDGAGYQPPQRTVGLNLSYTINLNLPATSDQSVFNAIFKSLKENLLKGD